MLKTDVEFWKKKTLTECWMLKTNGECWNRKLKKTDINFNKIWMLMLQSNVECRMIVENKCRILKSNFVNEWWILKDGKVYKI